MRPTCHIVRRVVWTETHHPRHPFVSLALAIYRYVGIKVPDCEILHRSRAIGYVKANHLHILKGYAWNGMTLYPEKDQNKDDSIVHDFHYQTGLIPRRPADKILGHMARAHDDFSWGIYLGVRTFGWKFYARDRHIRIIREPQSDDHDLASDLTY